VIEDLLVARLERLDAQKADGSLVQAYTAGARQTGIHLHRSLRLALFKNGQGLAIQLTPGMARDLARQLERVADAAEAPAKPEDIH
jgi:hypothetical protein